MNKLVIQGLVLVLMLAALPLTSIGTTTPLQWLAYAGLASLAVGAITMPILRFVGDDDSDNNGDGQDSGQDDVEDAGDDRSGTSGQEKTS